VPRYTRGDMMAVVAGILFWFVVVAGLLIVFLS